MTLLDPSTNAPNAQADADLQTALSAFDQSPIQGIATNVLKANAAAAEAVSVPELPEETSEAVEESTEEVDVEETEETEEENSAFAVEFEQEFGMKPTEAIALVQELQGFRQELALMREWQVSPVEYDSRIQAVKQFYSTLPEGEREKFNSPEGAKAIWNHLQKQGAQTTKNVRQPRSRAGLKPVKAQQPVELIKRSDILRMDEETYRRELPRITKAFQENRVVD